MRAASHERRFFRLATTPWRTSRIILAAAVTALAWRSAWPDLLVGLAIVAMNSNAAREVWAAAREEHAED